ncbi:N-acetyl-anhydromuranmyl-L-alanine amidase [Colwellia sp. MT41]|uniref:1,6-anhydro-N-acetylmuramyl-L-alanine amidase AmpD n=1 Tax=Colwellia marinimaniae TaxID=1513592 RepID=A0ABQ0MW55_9GAMM|nr:MULTISPECIES: 1,6-anhydro-N-acetylmuramyl-L-alanine amidase AmpD [Colwellia]ALO36271.1 N-acetyl-anhydromuranmyl-L-alanine amidase [Colwellia sp. MT41]GAW96606.1 N-acetyl-anhydromuranmyl-L-alanine amidase [Colwellia marinimaniae]
MFSISSGWLAQAQHFPSPYFSPRELADDISLLVIHNISLPAGQFGGNCIHDLFLGQLDCNAHASFNDLQGVEVSAHCLIRRDGRISQYVSFDDKAWHAGASSFRARPRCNDYSIGIELEGTDDICYTAEQYQQLIALTLCLQNKFPGIIMSHIVGHCDIAPGRKTDPGPVFDWQYFRQCLTEQATRNNI